MKSNQRIAASLAVVISLFGWVAPPSSHGQQGNKAADQEAREARKKEREAKKAERAAKKEERREGQGGNQAKKEERAAKKEEREAKREARKAKKEEGGGATAEERQAARQKRRDKVRDEVQPAAAGQPGANNPGEGDDPSEVKGKQKDRRAADRRRANANATGEGEAASEASQGGQAGEQPAANAQRKGAERNGTATKLFLPESGAISVTGQAPAGAAPASKTTGASATSTGASAAAPASSSGARVQGAAPTATGVMDRIPSAAGAAGGTGKTSEPPPTTTDTPGTETRPPSHGSGSTGNGGNSENDRPPSTGGGTCESATAVEENLCATEASENIFWAMNSVNIARNTYGLVDQGGRLARFDGYSMEARTWVDRGLDYFYRKQQSGSLLDGRVNGEVMFVKASLQAVNKGLHSVKSAKGNLERALWALGKAHENGSGYRAKAIDATEHALQELDAFIENYQPPAGHPSDGSVKHGRGVTQTESDGPHKGDGRTAPPRRTKSKPAPPAGGAGPSERSTPQNNAAPPPIAE